MKNLPRLVSNLGEHQNLQRQSRRSLDLDLCRTEITLRIKNFMLANDESKQVTFLKAPLHLRDKLLKTIW